MPTPKQLARLAGLLYLALIIFGVFAELYVRQGIAVSGDAIATSNNVMISEQLLRLGFLSDLAMQTTYIILVVVLYQLLHNFGKIWAIFMVSCVLVSTAIMGMNMMNHYTPLLLLNNADLARAFDSNQLNAMILLSFEKHSLGYLIAQPTFGLWLFPLGYLGWKSDYFPKILSAFLMIATFSYLVDLVLIFAFPEAPSIITEIVKLPTIIGEFGICLWLIVMGVKGNPKFKAA